MNKKYLLAVFFLLAVFQYSCKQKSGTYKMGFLVHTLADERWAIERDVFTSKVEQLGGSVIFNNAEQDERNQYHLAKKMIGEGIDVLVIVPVNSKTAASISRLCEENNVKLIAYDIIIENSKLDLYISFDNEKIGEMMASYAIKQKPSGNYVLLWGDSNMRIAHWIKEGQMKVLNPYIESKAITVLYKSYVESWSSENSTYLMNRILDFSDKSIDVIIASSDGIASGVIESYHKNGNEFIPLLTGQDASQMALKYIEEGKQSMTIRKNFSDLATIAAVCAYKLASNEAIEPDTLLNNGRFDIASILLHTSIVDK